MASPPPWIGSCTTMHSAVVMCSSDQAICMTFCPTVNTADLPKIIAVKVRCTAILLFTDFVLEYTVQARIKKPEADPGRMVTTQITV